MSRIPRADKGDGRPSPWGLFRDAFGAFDNKQEEEERQRERERQRNKELDQKNRDEADRKNEQAEGERDKTGNQGNNNPKSKAEIFTTSPAKGTNGPSLSSEIPAPPTTVMVTSVIATATVTFPGQANLAASSFTADPTTTLPFTTSTDGKITPLVTSSPKGNGSGRNKEFGKNGGFRKAGLSPEHIAGITIGSILCFFIVLACIVYIFRRVNRRGSWYGSNSSYISSRKSSSSGTRRSRMSRDRQMEESLLGDEDAQQPGFSSEQMIEKPRPARAISRWMSEVDRHELTDPTRLSVSLPSGEKNSQGQPADISDVSSVITTAVTHTTHSTNGFKTVTPLSYPNLPSVGAILTHPINPAFNGQSPTIWISPATPYSSSTSSQNNNTRADVFAPSIPPAARLSGVGVIPQEAYSQPTSYYNRDSIESYMSSMSLKSKRRSI